jgi:hypothetical protein
VTLPNTLGQPPTPHRAIDLFADDLQSPDDGRALDALRSISNVLDRQQLDMGRILRRGLEAVGSSPPSRTHFDEPRDAARALISSGFELGRKAGQFCGGLVFESERLTDAQDRWLRGLLRRAGLPPLLSGEP